MREMELEVKVLNINEEEFIKKLEALGGKLIEKSTQYIYTYDLPTIYGRFIEALIELEDPTNEIYFEVAFDKLKLLFFEVDNLLNDKQRQQLKQITGYKETSNIILQENRLEILKKKELLEFMSQFRNNRNKWIRLRKTNQKVTLTVKHILKQKEETCLQQLLETEIDVPSMKEANEFLEGLGFAHKCYLEKRRISYLFHNHTIDIDTWPKLPTYFEMEGKDEQDIEEVLALLGYTMKDTVSCVVDGVYELYGLKTTNHYRELKLGEEE